MEYSIELRDVNKAFSARPVIRGATLSVPAGKITGFVGPDGSGKTTLMRIMCGTERPDSGAGQCCGIDIFANPEQIRPLTGDMSQNISLAEQLTVKENLLSLAKSRSVPYAKMRVDELIDELNLAHLSNTLALHLTTEYKLRVSLAASILHSPKVLMLDEPTAGIVPEARHAFWLALEKLSAKGMTVLVSTHYSDEAERCHHLVRMLNGRVLSCGPAQAIVHSLGLTTFAIRGPDLMSLKCQFSSVKEVEQTVIFSNTLYVTGKQCDGLLSAVRMLPVRYQIEHASYALSASVENLTKNVTVWARESVKSGQG